MNYVMEQSYVAEVPPPRRRVRRDKAPVAPVAPAAPPAAPNKPDDAKLTTLKVAGGLLVPLAMGLSYARNKSIPLAFVHGAIGPAYVAYRGVQYAGVL